MRKYRLAIPTEKRLEAVEAVLNNHESPYRIGRKLGVTNHTVMYWVRAYQLGGGPQGLEEGHHQRKYSLEIKQKAVEAYLTGNFSLDEVVTDFKISGSTLLKSWIDLYTRDKLFNPSRGKNTMKQGRKTTQAERLTIVKYTIDHDLNYQKACAKYQVSYDQVYSWVHKYKNLGEVGLEDRRGKSLAQKPNKTETETLKAELQAKDAQIEYLKAEVGLLKKLEEIQRRRN